MTWHIYTQKRITEAGHLQNKTNNAPNKHFNEPNSTKIK